LSGTLLGGIVRIRYQAWGLRNQAWGLRNQKRGNCVTLLRGRKGFVGDKKEEEAGGIKGI
jgi:hypothetical protein